MMRLLKRRKKERERLQHNIRWIGYPHLLMIFLSSIRSKDRGRRLGHVLTMKLMQLKIIDIQLLHFLSYHFTCTVSLISHTSLGSSKIHSLNTRTYYKMTPLRELVIFTRFNKMTIFHTLTDLHSTYATLLLSYIVMCELSLSKRDAK
jgi:hypothetical protein